MTARFPDPVTAKQAQNTTMLDSWYEMFVLICCLVFALLGIVHYSQTSPFWSRLSKGHGSRSLEVCADATLQT